MTDTRDRGRPMLAVTLSRVGHGVLAELTRLQGVSRSAVVEIAIRKEAIALGIDLDDVEAKIDSGALEIPSGRTEKAKPKARARVQHAVAARRKAK